MLSKSLEAFVSPMLAKEAAARPRRLGGRWRRDVGETDLIERAHRSTLDELTAWSLEADKVLVF